MAWNHNIYVNSFKATTGSKGIRLSLDLGEDYADKVRFLRTIANEFVSDRTAELDRDRIKLNNATHHANSVIEYLKLVEGSYKDMSDVRLGRYVREMLSNAEAVQKQKA